MVKGWITGDPETPVRLRYLLMIQTCSKQCSQCCNYNSSRKSLKEHQRKNTGEEGHLKFTCIVAMCKGSLTGGKDSVTSVKNEWQPGKTAWNSVRVGIPEHCTSKLEIQHRENTPRQTKQGEDNLPSRKDPIDIGPDKGKRSTGIGLKEEERWRKKETTLQEQTWGEDSPRQVQLQRAASAMQDTS